MYPTVSLEAPKFLWETLAWCQRFRRQSEMGVSRGLTTPVAMTLVAQHISLTLVTESANISRSECRMYSGQSLFCFPGQRDVGATHPQILYRYSDTALSQKWDHGLTVL
jgi:hypothetical protein